MASPSKVLSETLSSPEMASPSLGLSHSLQEPVATHGDSPQRSYSAPSTSRETLATAQSLSARSLSITWGQDERYWTWRSRAGSRFSEVAYLVDVSWLEVEGQLHISTLRPGTYSLSWRLEVACSDEGTKPSGWDSEPILFKFSTSDGHQQAERVSFLGGTSAEVSTSDKKSPLVQTLSPEKSKGGWMDYVVGTFNVQKKQTPVLLTFSMSEVNGGWKRGLFLDGVFITPCSDPGNEPDSEDAEIGWTGLEDSPGLPGILSFPGHDHELQLMTDPFWFSCGVCEATEQVMGYHCRVCSFSVHLQCCISDYQFANLLELTDSEFSHWNWDALLELNKHRKEEKALRPKTVMFTRHPHLLKLTQVPHPTFICDAHDCDAQGWVFRGWDGWVYHCAECDFDVHPECRLGF